MNRRSKKKKQVTPTEVLAPYFHWWHCLPTFHQRAIIGLFILVMVLIALPQPDKQVVAEVTAPEVQRVEVSVDTTDLSQQSTGEEKPVVQTDQWHEYTVKEGDTLSQVFRANDLPLADLNALIKIEGLDKPLSRITAGQLIRFKLTSDGQVDILQLERNNASVMFFRMSDGGFGRSK